MPKKINPRYVVDGKGGREPEYVVCRGIPVPRSIIDKHTSNNGVLVTSERESQVLDQTLVKYIRANHRLPKHIADNAGSWYTWENIILDFDIMFKGLFNGKGKNTNLAEIPAPTKIWFRYPRVFVKG